MTLQSKLWMELMFASILDCSLVSILVKYNYQTLKVHFRYHAKINLVLLTCSFHGFRGQVKERRVKKIKEMDPNPLVCSENALLAERSFMSGQDKPSVENGYHLEWTEKIAANIQPSQGVHSKVMVCGL